MEIWGYFSVSWCLSSLVDSLCRTFDGLPYLEAEKVGVASAFIM